MNLQKNLLWKSNYYSDYTIVCKLAVEHLDHGMFTVNNDGPHNAYKWHQTSISIRQWKTFFSLIEEQTLSFTHT
jgi:hypothetical protein